MFKSLTVFPQINAPGIYLKIRDFRGHLFQNFKNSGQNMDIQNKKTFMSSVTAIRGHHVYKQMWTPSLGEILKCKKDNRQEALDHDEYAVGVYSLGFNDAEMMLVGHVPSKLSMLLSGFLKVSEKNTV